MKRWFFLVLVLMGLGGVLGLMVLRDPGYVLVSWQQTSVEMGLWLGGLLWLLSVIAAVAVIDVLFKLLGLTSWWARLMSARRQRRSQQAFEVGTMRLERGDWAACRAATVHGGPLVYPSLAGLSRGGTRCGTRASLGAS
jgi:HemY protein